ncbi:uncharacterized protein [Scyliorhinus torazame]|uniref:uncharacterized protein n=1 Tax=Scyliorhinus torazame TaxID=75743 RepID=UPI003B59EAB1
MQGLAQSISNRCLICQQYNTGKGIPCGMGQTPLPSGPFETLQMDYIELERCQCYKYVLVIVDGFSRWVEAYPTTDNKAATVVKVLMREIIPQYSIPAQLSSDNGPHFLGQINLPPFPSAILQVWSMMGWLRTVCVIFGLTSLGVLLAMDMEKGNIIYICNPNQSTRIHHLCKGDVLRCPHIRGHGIDSWKVVKVKENAGVMKQLHRSRRWEGNIALFWSTCKFDFGCVKIGAIKVTSDRQESIGRGYERERVTRERTGRVRREVQLERRLPGDTLKLVKGKTEENLGSMNYFYQIYHRLYGHGRVVCYPDPAAVSRLFSVSPLWGTPQTVVHCQRSEPPPEQVTLPYDPGSAPPAICLPLPRGNSHSQYDRLQRWRAYIPSHFTPNRDSRSYENCFNSEGYGCLLIEVETNITCLFPTCTDRRCHITQALGQCVCYNTTCVPLNAGLQLLCGWGNVSHITVGTRAFRIARRPEWAFRS